MLGSTDDFKELVRSKTDLVALIGESVALRPERGGRNFKGLCPFHDDNNPSFTVNPERQSYRCWACNEAGDCYSYLMKLENLGFREALEQLARRAGLEMPTNSPRSSEESRRTPELYDILAWAEEEFHRCLIQDPIAASAREYLKSRGFRAETIGRFRLGFHPRQPNWLMGRVGRKFTEDQVLAAGLLQARDEGGGYRDFFADRVIFPIRDERKRVVAFGGRVLPQNESWTRGDGTIVKAAKYKNSSESPVFHKSKMLFGLGASREAIVNSGTAVVVEGYTDCIKCHQAGLENVVGSLGTAFTELQVALLKRFARKVILLFDGDNAGKTAAERAIPKFLAQEVDLRVLLLPDGLDPDEFLQARGTDALRKLLDEAPEAWEFWYREQKSRHGLQSVDSRQRVLESMLGLLAEAPGLSGTYRETAILKQLLVGLGIEERELRNRLEHMRRNQTVVDARRKLSVTGVSAENEVDERRMALESLQRNRNRDDVLECEFLRGVFTDPRTIAAVRAEVGPDHFQNVVLRELVCYCFDLAEQGEEPTFERVLARVECPVLKATLVWLDDQTPNRGQGSPPAMDAVSDVENGNHPLRWVLDRLKWRRDKDSHLAKRGRLAEQIQQSEGLTAEKRELLQHLTWLYQRPGSRKLKQ